MAKIHFWNSSKLTIIDEYYLRNLYLQIYMLLYVKISTKASKKLPQIIQQVSKGTGNKTYKNQ